MDNYTRAVLFERPDYIPVNFVINAACWHHYPKEEIWELMESHPYLFPDFVRPSDPWEPEYAPVARRDAPYRDPMGCLWVTSDDGITGTVREHPLAELKAFHTTWHLPDPEKCDGLYDVDWAQTEAAWKKKKAETGTLPNSLRHGHTFLQLSDLMGYENLLYAMMDGEPLLDELLGELTEFNLSLVRRFIKNGSTLLCYPEDLGMQVGPMLSPEAFRRYIKPAYQKLMAPAREAGIPIQMHSDGDIRLLCDDLVDSGVQSINLQDLCNGVDWIAEKFRGRVCVDLDIDRQKITPYGTPADVEALIREETLKLGSKAGGLAFTYGWYPGVPLGNAKALMDALEKYMFYFS